MLAYNVTDRQTDRQTDGRTDGRTDRRTNRKMDRIAAMSYIALTVITSLLHQLSMDAAQICC